MPADNKPSNMDEFMKGLWKENPVFVMLLGMCPILAVTNTVENCITMGLATSFVLIMSSTLISLLRNLIPKEVRIATFIIIIATFVTMVDYTIKAISLNLYDQLGPFIPLIVVNCIILGRAEAFASKNPVLKTFFDATGMCVGFTFALLCLGVVRELLGKGSIYNIPVFGENFEPWVIMILPPGAFFVLGGWLLVFNWIQQKTKKKKEQVTTDA